MKMVSIVPPERFAVLSSLNFSRTKKCTIRFYPIMVVIGDQELFGLQAFKSWKTVIHGSNNFRCSLVGKGGAAVIRWCWCWRILSDQTLSVQTSQQSGCLRVPIYSIYQTGCVRGHLCKQNKAPETHLTHYMRVQLRLYVFMHVYEFKKRDLRNTRYYFRKSNLFVFL